MMIEGETRSRVSRIVDQRGGKQSDLARNHDSP
jgi:hypothetical protein